MKRWRLLLVLICCCFPRHISGSLCSRGYYFLCFYMCSKDCSKNFRFYHLLSSSLHFTLMLPVIHRSWSTPPLLLRQSHCCTLFNPPFGQRKGTRQALRPLPRIQYQRGMASPRRRGCGQGRYSHHGSTQVPHARRRDLPPRVIRRYRSLVWQA